jgi:hypothetical protein
MSCMIHQGFQQKAEFKTAAKAKAELTEVAWQVSVIHAVKKIVPAKREVWWRHLLHW